MAKQGDWVRIHRVILPAEERTANLPEDTKKVPFEMWVKGHLLEDGELVGKGTHEELLESCAVYREIHESQFKGEEVIAQ